MQGKKIYQPLLFTTIQIESLIPQNHLLRKLDETLDLSFVREMTEPFYSKDTGRSSVDPEVFVRMLLVEYLYDIPSDRQLCEEIGFNLVYRWFCRFSLEDDIPDHSSMTKIRDRLGEKTFQKIFIHVVKLCEQKGLLKGKRVMTDGSLIRANAAIKSLEDRKKPDGKEPPDEPKSTASNEESKPAESEESEPESKSKSIKGKKFSNKTHVSKTDPDCTLAGKTDEPKKLRYNLHQSIDPDHRIIIDCHITTGATPDGTVYRDRILQIESTFGYKIEEATADRGYGYGENLQFLKDKGIRSFIPRFHKDVSEKIDREKTPYDEESNEFKCELGNRLFPYPIQSDGVIGYRPKVGSCNACERKPWCTIKRWGLKVNSYFRVQHEARLMEQTEEFKIKRTERMWKSEGLFAEGKTFHGQGRARYRGKWKVQMQAYMIASIQNLKRLMGAGLGDFISLLLDLISFVEWPIYFQKVQIF